MRAHPGAEPQPYISSARVLLNGLGSDELLGGYGRHRTAFKAGGWQAVINEVRIIFITYSCRKITVSHSSNWKSIAYLQGTWGGTTASYRPGARRQDTLSSRCLSSTSSPSYQFISRWIHGWSRV